MKKSGYGRTGASAIAVHPDGALIAVPTREGRVVLWDAQWRQLTRTVRRGGQVTSAAWVDGGAGLVVTGSDGSLARYDKTGKTLVKEVDTKHRTVRGLSVHPSGKRLATCGKDGCVRVWDAESLELAWENGIDGAPAFDSVAMLGIAEPEAPMTTDALVAGWADGRFAVFAGPGEEGNLLTGGALPASISSAASRPGGGSVVLGGDRGGLVALSTSMADQWPKLQQWAVPPKPIAANAIAFSPDGARFVVAASDGAAHLLEWDTWRTAATLGVPFYERRPEPDWSERLVISGAAFAPNGQTIYTSCLDGSISAWRIAEGEPQQELLFDSNNP